MFEKNRCPAGSNVSHNNFISLKAEIVSPVRVYVCMFHEVSVYPGDEVFKCSISTQYDFKAY